MLEVEVTETRVNAKLITITGVVNIWSQQNMVLTHVVIIPNI